MKLYSKTINTPVADLTVICSDSHIIRLSFQNDNCVAWLKRYFGAVEFCGENELCRRCEEELTAYMEGHITQVSLPVKLYGTEYEEKIWQALRLIPYGKTASYAQLGLLAGLPGARAAGNALGRKPIAILFPATA